MSLMLPLLLLLHLEASDAETDALVAGRWVTALAFDFQHFGQLFGPRNNGGTTQEQKAEQTPEHKNAKKKGCSRLQFESQVEEGRETGSVERVDKRPCRFI